MSTSLKSIWIICGLKTPNQLLPIKNINNLDLIKFSTRRLSTSYFYPIQLTQAELGLDYYVARWYDPLTGHFTQADSIIPEPGKASAIRHSEPRRGEESRHV